ncbi:MAG: RNA polymerase factor sigma-54 [Clostridium perfringens]|nr:RNA polymerase factor sigma-54 [Clostridium perfringens]
MNFNLNLTQEQKLIMTQQMQLSVKLLQMSTSDLRDYIEKEFLENPVLEAQYETGDDKKKEQDRLEYKELIKYLESDNYGSQSYGDYDEDSVSPFTFISNPKSLKEYLLEQIIDLPIDDYLRSICSYMIESLDNRGYLDIKNEEIEKELGCGEENIQRALILLHNLEPAGIGARNIKECLILQLKRLGRNNEILIDIINNHLQDLADNKYQVIGKALKITAKEAQAYGDLIKTLEPKPSRGFYTGEDMKFIIPDAEIRKIDGQFFVIMNDRVLPKLSINSMYSEILNNNDDKDAVKYIEEKIGRAVFLVKSIDQRKSTLHKVLEKIVEKQKGYFEKGERELIPMTLREIAEEIGMHESTVSRAIREKYILTSFGTIKIKDLFTNGIQGSSKGSSESEDISVINIKKSIEKLINEEDKLKPLSDQIICEKLNKDGMNISRRTVAKYREEMGIKSSSKRKRF